MKKSVLIACVFLIKFVVSSCGQLTTDQKKSDGLPVGGGCEGCELMYVGMPKEILSEHTSPGWSEGKQKLLVTGKVYQQDGRTPAPNVIVYYWHTDDRGLYSAQKNTPAAAVRHGHLRGWVKSDPHGHYTIRTSRPAHYPNEEIAAHIHLAIKEPGIANEYYADLYFDDDPTYLKHKKTYGKLDRAGTEVLRVLQKEHVQVAEHTIVCGLNIPNYPQKPAPGKSSGLAIGEDQPSFMPFHAFGPDKGTRTCPVCKYGRYHGIVYVVGNQPRWDEIKKWLLFLDEQSAARKGYLKAYFVYANASGYHADTRQKELEQIGRELGIKNIALTFVPSLTDTDTEMHLNKINPSVENTFIVYRHRTIVEKFIDLKPSPENFQRIAQTLDQTRGEYFHLRESSHH